MKKLLLAILCAMLMTTCVIFADNGSVDVNVKIEKTAEGYLVTIPNDSSYASLKPVMSVFDSEIKNAYVVKLDGNGNDTSSATAIKNVDGKLSFTVTSGGIYKIVPCAEIDSNNNVYNDVYYDSSIGSVSNLEGLSSFLSKLFDENVSSENKKAAVNLTGNQLAELKDLVNSTDTTLVLNQYMKIEQQSEPAQMAKDYLRGNSSYSASITFDISIRVDYSVVGENNGGSFFITSLNDPVSISLDIPEDVAALLEQGKELELSVITVHNGELQDPIEASIVNDRIVFSAKDFSSFTLIYKEKTVASSNSQASSGPEPVLKSVVNTCAK